MNTPVSVVIPTYNAEAHIEASLDSVFRQRADLLGDVIVVDDGSIDGTLAKIAGYPGLICLRQPNRGPAAARNAGIERATGEFVAFLDADDLWPEDKLQAQVDLLRRHPDAALSFGDCRQFEGTRLWPRTLFEAGGYGEGAWGPGAYLPDAYARLLRDNFITTGSVVIRRQLLNELGGFDEDLRLVEDLELWLRVARRHPIVWCGQVCLLRRRHEGNISLDPDAMSLAYLEVLRRQAGLPGRELEERGIALNDLFAQEYLALADRALLRRRPEVALRWAWRSFRARPGLRPMWRLVQGTGQRLARSAG